MAIQFPKDDLYEGREYKPEGSSITYIYEGGSWLLLPAEVPVSKEYVDTQDFLKYDKSGGKVSGDVRVGVAKAADNLVFTQDGEITLKSSGQQKINFEPTITKASTINVSGEKFISFTYTLNSIDVSRTLKNTNPDRDFLTYDSPGRSTDVVILKMPTVGGTTIRNTFVLSNSSSSFVVREDEYDSLVVQGDGRTSVVCNENSSLEVLRRTGQDKSALKVSTYDYKIHTSSVYNDGLVAGGLTIQTPTGNESYVTYDEDNLVATLGAVKRYQYTPGQKVFADSQAEAEEGGLWMDSTGFYIRYK